MRYRTYPKWGFALVSAMSGFGGKADVIASGSERPLLANNGSRLHSTLVKIAAEVVRNGRCVTFQLAEVAVSRDLFRKILILIDDLRPRPAPAKAEEIHGKVETTGEVRLDDDNIGRMGFRTRPTNKNRAIRKAEVENLSNDGAIWVTSPWKPSYLGYIG